MKRRTRYRSKNLESTIDLYIKERLYVGALLPSIKKYSNLVNFNFGEKFLFGRTDLYFVPIELSPAYLQNDNHTGFGVTRAIALNFVLDTFNLLAQQFNKARAAGKISKDDPYLSDLKIYKSYINPHKLYTKYFNIYFSSITANFRKDPYPPMNFEEFISRFLNMIDRTAHHNPLTKTGFVKSRHCPILCSGLAIEIADLSYANDEDKINKFVNSKNWEFYVNTCNSYGFMIDRKVPWRLVADIGNPNYIELFMWPRTGVRNKQTLFNRLYNPVHEDYYRAFKYYLLRLYNGSTRRVTKTKYCQESGNAMQYRVSPRSYDAENLTELIPEEMFLKTYMQIRFMEEESKFTESEQKQLIREVLDSYHASPDNLNSILYFFEFIINKTIDYSGSVSYIKRAKDEIKNKIPEQQTTTKQYRRTKTYLEDGRIAGPPPKDGVE